MKNSCIIISCVYIYSSELTRDYRQHSIITQCRDTKAKLKELIVTCEAVMGGEDMAEMIVAISECVATIKAKSGVIKREVCTIHYSQC